MHPLDFERILENVEFMTDEQLEDMAFRVWVVTQERYAKDAIASAATYEIELPATYGDIRGN